MICAPAVVTSRPHAHRCEHRLRDGEVLPGLIRRALSPMELPESEMTACDERTHPDALGDFDRPSEGAFGFIDRLRVMPRRDLAEEAVDERLVPTLPVRARERQGRGGESGRVLLPIRQQ